MKEEGYLSPRATPELAVDAARLACTKPDPAWRKLSPSRDDHWYEDSAGKLYWREGSPSQRGGLWE